MNTTKLIFVFWTLLIPTVATSSDGNPYEEFVLELNSLRSGVAKRYKINNMYKLYWSDSLMKSAKKSQRPENTSYFSMHSSETTDAKIKKILNSVKRVSSSNEQNLFVPMGAHQKEIGCFNKDGIDHCLLAPEKEFKLMEYKGTKDTCETGYEKKKDLCDKVGFKKDFLNRVNAMRRKIARKYNVSNMHELVWSASLGDMFKQTVLDNNRKIQLNDFYLNETDLETEVEEFLKLSEREKNSGNTKVYVELMAPLQEIIGCHWNPSKELYDCAIGHRHSLDFWNFDDKFIGPPGSECSYGYTNNYGLCEMINGNEEITLENVNDVRRSVAFHWRIPNMHALVWDENLVNLARTLKIDTLEESRNHTWNYFVFHSSADVRPKLYAETKLKRNTLDFVDPNQRRIGCETMNLTHGDGTRYVCLIGPQGNPRTADDLPGKQTPATKCDEGYVADYGLCMDLGNRTDFLEAMNIERRQFANKHNVTNMHEMIWNEELVEIAKSQTWSERNPLKHGDHWRYVTLRNYRNIPSKMDIETLNLQSLTASERDEKFKILYETSLGVSELLDPLQRFIGCDWKDRKVDRGLLCVIGPGGHTKIWKFENPPIIMKLTHRQFVYTPGSNCSCGYENTDGLCTVAQNSKLTLFGNQEYFLKDLNQIRRAYAIQFRIGRMHELQWNSDLDVMVKALDYKLASHWHGARNAFRWVKLSSYNSAFDSIDLQVRDMKKWTLSGEIDEKWVNLEKKESAGELELVEPEQYMIACDEKKTDGGEKFILCVLGPQETMELWNFRGQFIWSLAAKCNETEMRFVANDGLCVPGPTTKKMSYFGDREEFLYQVNKARRERGVALRIPDYRAMSWSNRLMKLAKEADWNDTSAKPIHPKTDKFRYFRTETYKLTEPFLVVEHIHKMEEKSEEDQERYMRERKDTTMEYLELFNRRCWQIGCAVKTTPTGSYLLCLTGPSKKYDIPTEWLFPTIAGSECPKGTVNEEVPEKWRRSTQGLCIVDKSIPKSPPPLPTTTTTPATTPESSTASESSGFLTPGYMAILIIAFLIIIV